MSYMLPVSPCAILLMECRGRVKAERIIQLEDHGDLDQAWSGGGGERGDGQILNIFGIYLNGCVSGLSSWKSGVAID